MARRTGQSPLPPPLEMECLGVLWTLGEGTVRDVAAALAPRKPMAYTTVMTLLERLVKRGRLARRKVRRSYVYVPAEDPAELREIAVGELTRDYFGGSREALREWLAGKPGGEREAETTVSEPIDTALL
ncbi:MAG: BlaI/MecI/CopY family transcriptional regulator [Bryobacterales bacterium]|nr:BlaI/MecI/CopY family transcriptional regulator [Bryobacterales bacterium]